MKRTPNEDERRHQSKAVVAACDELHDELARLVKRVASLRTVAECGGFNPNRCKERAAVTRASLDVSEALVNFREQVRP